MPSIFLRSATGSREMRLAILATSARETTFRCRLLLRLKWLATAASDAAVPEVAMTFFIFAAVIRFTTLFTSRATNPRRLVNSPLRGGS